MRPIWETRYSSRPFTWRYREVLFSRAEARYADYMRQLIRHSVVLIAGYLTANGTLIGQSGDDLQRKCGFSRNRSLILSSNRSPFSGSRSARSERSDAGFLIVTGSDRNGKRFFLNPERSAGWPAGSRDGGRGKGRRLRPFPSVLSDPGAALYRSGSWGGFLRIDSPRSSMR
jgi:hypothetical protein